MKTLLIYNDFVSPIQFIVVDGDYSKFHGVAVNSVDGNGFEDEFVEWMFDENGNNKLEWTDDIALVEGKEWDKVAICTFIP